MHSLPCCASIVFLGFLPVNDIGVPVVKSFISPLTKSGDIVRHSTYGMELTELPVVRNSFW